MLHLVAWYKVNLPANDRRRTREESRCRAADRSLYERRRLLPRPHRWSGSGYRDFDDEALTCLRFIRGAKAVGFTLSEIKQLLDLRVPPRGSCAEVAMHFKNKISELDRQMAAIQRMRAALQKMMAACRGRKRNESCLALWKLEKPG
jgi:MerR family copper efflux transcriptional regulator